MKTKLCRVKRIFKNEDEMTTFSDNKNGEKEMPQVCTARIL
jgi:hypothetical protein